MKADISKKEAIFHILFWIGYFSTLNTSWTDNWLDKSTRPDTSAPLSVLLTPIFFYLNAFWLIPNFLKSKNWYRYFLVTSSILLLTELVRSLVFMALTSPDGDFFTALWNESWSRDNLIIGVPNSMFFAFFLSFAYRFTKDWIISNQLIGQLKAEKMEMELRTLKSQINPHFLFNNLNTLDDLIDRDKQLAKDYLQRLSALYRYLVSNADENAVSLQQEWDFIGNYIYLLETRFGVVYQFEKINDLGNLRDYLIPTASLQLLLENAVKHNQGSIKEPLHITIKASKEGISVSHIKRPKMTAVASLGTGLKNLKARYKFLSDEAIVIKDGETFSVLLPLIRQLT